MKKKMYTLLCAIVIANNFSLAKTKIGDLYYILDATSQTAEVTFNNLSRDGTYQLTTVNIPSTVTDNGVVYNVTGISNYAFYYSSSITSISIPSSVTTIGKEAFIKCTGITNISLPSSIVSIGEGAFLLCSNLYSINLPNGITTIEKSTFDCCTSLRNITIPTSVSSIGELAFSSCAITSANIIPTSVTYIGRLAFSYCDGLTTINIPSNVTTIGSRVFYNCTNLRTVNISDGVTKIEEGAFWGCSSLRSINIPNSIIDVEANILSGCIQLTSPVYNAHIFVGLPTTYAGNYSIPDGIHSISGGAFGNCTNLSSVSIPNSVIAIGEGAFYNCTSLTTITFPEGVTSIEPKTFYKCNSLTSTNMSDSITSIGEYAFKDCKGLSSITIPENCTDIGKEAFYNCKNLTSIVWNARNCNAYNLGSQVTSFSFGNAVEIIPANLCQGMNLLTSITIPGRVVSLGDKVFNNCSSLEKIILLPNTPPTIGNDIVDPVLPIYIPCGTLGNYQTTNWANYNIQYQSNEFNLEATSEDSVKGYVTIENNTCISSATAVPNYGYYFVRWSDGNTDNPRTLVLSKNTSIVAEFAIDKSGTCGKNDQLSWFFEDKTKTLRINGSGELTENYTYGIEAPTQMLNLIIGNEVTAIGDSAFYAMTTMRHLSIGSNIASIGNYAFAECKNYDDITCYATTVPTINATTFANIGNKYYIYLYVPEECQRAYKRDTYWSSFDIKPIVEATGVETDDIKVTPTDSSAVVSWPSITGAATYELVIKDKNGNIVCTLIFNAQGMLVQISFNAPARRNASQQAQANGFSFVVTGLDEGTTYDLVITAKDVDNNTIEEKTISFTTTGDDQGIENLLNNSSAKKIIDNKNIYILMPNGNKYSIIGESVK